ncbi:MAG: hypothetical protein RLZZ359_742 [Actinomycetota bacterium]|jgi:hypothetical protein
MKRIKVLKSAGRARNRNLIMSLAIIAASMAAVWFAIAQADQRQEYLVAKTGLSAGAKLTADSVQAIKVNLADSGVNYLKTLPGDQVAFLISSVRKGELIPLAQLVASASDTRVPVQITPTMGLSNQVKVGSAIDLWASRAQTGQVWGEPRILSLGAEVADITKPSGMFGDANPSLDLMVHPDDLPAVIYAAANGDKFAAILKPTLKDR